MPVFIYNVEQDGKLIRGKIRAKNLQNAKIRLNLKNIKPVYIKQQALVPLFAGGTSVRRKNILFFTRQLAFLLGSGISIVKAMEICVSNVEDQTLKSVLKQILGKLESGQSFSKALSSRPDIFDGFYINMVVCAEETGLLDQVLSDLAEYINKSETIKAKVKSAMMYPAIVLLISISIIMGIIIFIVPKFEALYAGSSDGLPALTQALVDLSHALRSNPLVIVGGIIAIPIIIYQYVKTEIGRKTLGGMVAFLPIFGRIQYSAGLVKFLRSFFSLLKSGVNFLNALDVARDVSGHDKIRQGSHTAKTYVTTGKSFAKGLESSRAFPPLVCQMAKIGEESGNLENTFEKLASFYEERLDLLISGLIKMIEPIMIVFLGSIIGIMILALYLPVFNMGSVVN